MATLPVKWYHSLMRGIPVVRGTKGTFRDFMDAVLVNGFGQVTTNSIIVKDGVATIAMANSETFLQHAVIEISGDDQLRGEYRVIDSNTEYIKVKINIPNQTFTNSIFVKYASLGWTTQRPTIPEMGALYTPKESHSGFNLYINDNWGSAVYVKMCKGVKNFDDISVPNDTLIDYVPRSENNFSCWFKNYNADNNPRSNFLIGDGSSIYYHWGRMEDGNHAGALAHGRTMFCGDVNRLEDIDKFGAVLMCQYTGNADYIGSTYGTGGAMAQRSSIHENYHNTGNNIYKTWLGSVSGIPGNTYAGNWPDGPAFTSWSGANSNYIEQSLLGGIELYKMLATTERSFRGYYPGFYYVGTAIESISDFTFEKGTGELSDKMLMIKKGCNLSGPYEYGDPIAMVFDITGPWR